MLAASVGGLAAGGGLYLAGARGAADAAWLAVTVLGLGYALLTLIDSLRRRRAGVDVIALLALAGALAVGELARRCGHHGDAGQRPGAGGLGGGPGPA